MGDSNPRPLPCEDTTNRPTRVNRCHRVRPSPTRTVQVRAVDGMRDGMGESRVLPIRGRTGPLPASRDTRPHRGRSVLRDAGYRYSKATSSSTQQSSPQARTNTDAATASQSSLPPFSLRESPADKRVTICGTGRASGTRYQPSICASLDDRYPRRAATPSNPSVRGAIRASLLNVGSIDAVVGQAPERPRTPTTPVDRLSQSDEVPVAIDRLPVPGPAATDLRQGSPSAPRPMTELAFVTLTKDAPLWSTTYESLGVVGFRFGSTAG